MSDYVIENGELKHYGVKGMRWGVSRAKKQFARATTREGKVKAVAKLQKHRAKATKKIDKLQSKQVGLQKKLDKHTLKTQTKEAALRQKAAKLRSKKYGLFTSKEKADMLEFKATKIEVKANKIKAKADVAKAAMAKNKRMTEMFEQGVNDIDKVLKEEGKRYIEG